MQITEPDHSRNTTSFPRTASSHDSAVVVDALHRRYGGPSGFEAVRGVSFTVERGEIFALLGTNGAGKTSTLEVVEGLSRPTRGRVSILGLDPVTDRRAVRPRIGIMLQQGGFPADLTVTETAKMWAGTLSHPRPVGEVLEMVGLDQRSGVGVKSLSGGERRRLDLALAPLAATVHQRSRSPRRPVTWDGAQLPVLNGRQTGASNRHEAVQIARRHGWI